jgi:hypothetical protein
MGHPDPLVPIVEITTVGDRCHCFPDPAETLFIGLPGRSVGPEFLGSNPFRLSGLPFFPDQLDQAVWRENQVSVVLNPILSLLVERRRHDHIPFVRLDVDAGQEAVSGADLYLRPEPKVKPTRSGPVSPCFERAEVAFKILERLKASLLRINIEDELMLSGSGSHTCPWILAPPTPDLLLICRGVFVAMAGDGVLSRVFAVRVSTSAPSFLIGVGPKHGKHLEALFGVPERCLKELSLVR